MRKVIVLALTLILCAVAVAEGMTPAMFIGSRGFVVMDENALNSMNNQEDAEPVSGKTLGGLKMCVYAPGSEESTEVIMFTDNDVYYAAFDMASAFSGHGSGTAMAQTFIDMCEAYDFDLYMFGSGTEPMAVYGETEAIMAAMEVFEASDEDILKFFENEDEFCDSKDDFMNAVRATIG